MAGKIIVPERRPKAKKDTTDTPAAKRFGPAGRLSAGDARDAAAQRVLKGLGDVFGGVLYPKFGRTVLPGMPIETLGLDPKTGKRMNK